MPVTRAWLPASDDGRPNKEGGNGTMPDIKNGDRVRVTYEGVISQLSGDSFLLNSGESGHGERYCFMPYAAVEVIGCAEPAYEVGALYVDANDQPFMRISSATPWRDTWGFTHGDDYPKRPLDRLVRQSA